ncbi:MAG: T9SS type A sorting domain-containing protein [bacterium]
MRLSVVLFAVLVLFLTSLVSAERLERAGARIPEQVIQNPPPGTYWDEDLGVFVFDPPIPIVVPQSMTLGEGADTIYFDGDTMYFAVPELSTHFVATKMATPPCGAGGWRLTSVLLGCYNNLRAEPDSGAVVVYAHHAGEMCVDPWMNPLGDSIGDPLGSQRFQGLDYGEFWNQYDPARAQWTQVDFDVPVVITDPEFWVAWDYTPLVFGNSYHVSGNFRPGYKPEDYEIFFEWWGSPCPQLYTYGPWLIRAVGSCVGGGPKIDIKPQSCPNPVNTRSYGVLPVAILGTDALDVTEVDPGSILLEGVPPIRTGIEDVAEPFPGELCDCWTEGPDGYDDLTIKFDKQEVVQALGVVKDRDTLELTLTWQMLDGSSMQGSDCIIIIDKATKSKGGSDGRQMGERMSSAQGAFALFQNSPNPFSGGTTIFFSLPAESHTTLTIHDLSGRTVATLVDAELSAGMHTVDWSGNVPSGVYFCRIQAGGMTAGTRMVLIR